MPIFDCRLLKDIGRSCHTTFSIVNRQSAIGNQDSAASANEHCRASSEGEDTRHKISCGVECSPCHQKSGCGHQTCFERTQYRRVKVIPIGKSSTYHPPCVGADSANRYLDTETRREREWFHRQQQSLNWLFALLNKFSGMQKLAHVRLAGLPSSDRRSVLPLYRPNRLLALPASMWLY